MKLPKLILAVAGTLFLGCCCGVTSSSASAQWSAAKSAILPAQPDSDACCAPTPAKPSASGALYPSEGVYKVIKITGMACENCAESVARAVRKSKGVLNAEASIERGAAFIVLKPGRTLTPSIFTNIERAGIPRHAFAVTGEETTVVHRLEFAEPLSIEESVRIHQELVKIGGVMTAFVDASNRCAAILSSRVEPVSEETILKAVAAALPGASNGRLKARVVPPKIVPEISGAAAPPQKEPAVPGAEQHHDN